MVLVFDGGNPFLGFFQQLRLVLRDLDIVDGNSDAGPGGIVEAELLDTVKHITRLLIGENLAALSGYLLENRLIDYLVKEAQFRGQDLIENNATDTGLDPFTGLFFPDFDFLTQVDNTELAGKFRLVEAAEYSGFVIRKLPDGGKVIAAENHVQGRGDGRFAAAGQQDIVMA